MNSYQNTHVKFSRSHCYIHKTIPLPSLPKKNTTSVFFPGGIAKKSHHFRDFSVSPEVKMVTFVIHTYGGLQDPMLTNGRGGV